MSDNNKTTSCDAHETESSSSDDETITSEFQEAASPASSDDEVDPFLFRIHETLAYAGLSYSYDVPSVFYDYLVLYLKSILRAMSEYKTHYQITCPMLTEGQVMDPNAVIHSTKVYYGRGRFTVEDFNNFLQEYDHLISNRGIYIKLMERIKKQVIRHNMVEKMSS